MAFINKYGQKISCDCGDLLIEELKQDISEFGGDLIVEVVTEERKGVTLYKDYNFIDDEETDFVLNDNEKLERMTASALLVLYEKENKIL